MRFTVTAADHREKAVRDAALTFVEARWTGEVLVTLRPLIRAARQLSCSLDRYLEDHAKHHDLLAAAYRLTARAARGESKEDLLRVELPGCDCCSCFPSFTAPVKR